MKKLLIALPIVLSVATARASNIIELHCFFGNSATYRVTARTYEDRAELTISGIMHILPRTRDGFFEHSDASYLTDDFEIGFVINPNDPHSTWANDRRYLLKVNGNEYPACDIIAIIGGREHRCTPIE
jgi:hypothetical protein